jgi:hypothetical protein
MDDGDGRSGEMMTGIYILLVHGHHDTIPTAGSNRV